MKSYKRFTIESHQILEQTTANPAKPNTVRRAGRFVRTNLRAGIQSARAQKPSTPIPSTSAPATSRLSSVTSRIPQPIRSAAGPAITGALEYQQRRDAGQSQQRAIGGAFSSLAGYAGGARIGAMAPVPLALKPVTAFLGGMAGQEASQKAYDWAADASRPMRRAISKGTGYDTSSEIQKLRRDIQVRSGAKPVSGPFGGEVGVSGGKVDVGTATRQAQTTVAARETRRQQAQARTPGTVTGSGIRGAGGQTTYSRTPKGAAFVSTGTGTQRRTAQLPSTMLLPGGRVGDLAFRGGKPTYLARPSVEATKQNPLQRFARSANLFGYRDRERAQQSQDVSRAATSTRRYYGQLGISAQKQKQLNPSLNVAPKPKSGITRRPAAAPAVPASTPSQGIAQARERLRMRRG